MIIYVLLSSIFIFFVSFIIHYGYDLLPNYFTSLFFPINESIWQHNKMIILAFFISMFIEMIILKNKNNIFNNIICALTCSLLVMLIFTPIYFYILNYNDNLFITLIIYFLAILISQFIKILLFKTKYNKHLEYLGILLWLIIFITNAVLTYYPLNNGLFYDYSNKENELFTNK